MLQPESRGKAGKGASVRAVDAGLSLNSVAPLLAGASGTLRVMQVFPRAHVLARLAAACWYWGKSHVGTKGKRRLP